jgi:sterol desaturase/sphingolipid hydroxylase (fatty acid hydroxylase superfamily)
MTQRVRTVQSKEPIRLFKSDFLEFFTHISPIIVLVIYLPVAAYFLWLAVEQRPSGSGWGYIPLGWLVGLVVWTLSEYLLHRFVFHFHPANASEKVERVLFLVHGVHHSQPRNKTRLVMPPVLSIPLALLFLWTFQVLVGQGLGLPLWVAPLSGGFTLGYLLYDMTHYSIHHIPMKRGLLKIIRKHHMHHHFQTPNLRYGVSSPFWDYIFRTNPAE